MFRSIVRRSQAFNAIVALAILILAAALLQAVEANRNGNRWLAHSATVLTTAGDTLGLVQQAESASRGYALTQNPAFAKGFDKQVDMARRAAGRLVTLTADNPAQQSAATALLQHIDLRLDSLQRNVQLSRTGKYEAAREALTNGTDLERMDILSDSADRFVTEERRLQAERMAASEHQLRTTTQIMIAGVVALLVLVVLMALTMARSIRQPVRVITETMAALAGGARNARIAGHLGSSEFDEVAAGYNQMADDLARAVADQREGADSLLRANQALQTSTAELQDRSEVIELLGSMAHRMQAARTDDELAAILAIFVPKVLPGMPGALYAHNNSRNLLVQIATWGGMTDDEVGFPPDQCWALRRGQSHGVGEPGSDILCGHLHGVDAHYHCEPLLAAGEVIGVIYLRGDVLPQRRFSLAVMSENISSALVNQRLQRGLREQTIRDPLTGLFNRRYMEEALGIEIARVARSGGPLSLIMCDIDHFKRFNDEFGHDAGDAVLSAVASEMSSRFRDGDVVCRYGGEEFTIIAPGTTAEQMGARAEVVRKAIADLQVRDRGRSLGATSMSFGIASWTPTMDRDGNALIKAADAALYQAKREGRNRVVLDTASAADE
jgi:diguanylate cyclase (GGDEF)-like protein